MQRLTLVNMGIVLAGAVITFVAWLLVETGHWFILSPFIVLPLFVGLMGGLWLGCRYHEWLIRKIKG